MVVFVILAVANAIVIRKLVFIQSAWIRLAALQRVVQNVQKCHLRMHVLLHLSKMEPLVLRDSIGRLLIVMDLPSTC